MLMHSIKRGQDKTIKLLIEKGANIDIKDKDGVTALMHTIKRIQKERFVM